MPPATRSGYGRSCCCGASCLPVIPPNPARKDPAPLDRELYRLRNRVERLVNKLKRYRAVATRYDKTAESFLALVHLAAARVWLRFVHTA